MEVSQAGEWFSGDTAAIDGGAIGVGYGASMERSVLEQMGLNSGAAAGSNDLAADADAEDTEI